MEPYKILRFGDPVLREKAKAVPHVNESARRTLDRMLYTMHEAAGVGLAAPQVGILKRMVVVDVGDGEGPYFLVNPEIVSKSDESEVKWEGCLSWPGYIGEVERPFRVTVKAQGRDGRDIWVEGEGFLARALCHELDHLDGVLFTDLAETITEAPPAEEGEEEESGLSSSTAVFMGSPDFAVPSLLEMVSAGVDIKLVVTQPDKPVGRRQALTPTPVKRQALLLDIPVLAAPDVAAPEAVSKIQEAQPDFVVVSAFGQKLPKAIIEAPRLACLNVHPSLLPKYRGGNPVQRAVMNGDAVTGVTIIYLSDKMDAGDILIQKSVEIDPDQTYGSLEGDLAVLGAKALVEAMALVRSGSAPRAAQDEGAATAAPHLKKGEDAIDWSRSSKSIHDLVRGLSPKPGAVTWFGDKRIKVWETVLLPDEKAGGDGGAIIRVEDKFVVVSTGDGAIGVRRIQPAGGKVMDAPAFLAGRQGAEKAFGRKP